MRPAQTVRKAQTTRPAGAAPARAVSKAPGAALLACVLALGLWMAPRLPAQDLDDLFNEPDAVTDGGAQADGDEAATSGDGATPTGEGDAQGTAAAGGEGADGAATDGEGGAAPPAVVDIEALTTSATTVSGTVSADAGVSVGYNEWPWSDAAEGRDLKDLLEVTAGYDMSASVSVDSRPAPYLRFFTRVKTSLNTTSLAFSNPAVEELFVDYTAADRVFFRVGAFGMAWGRARLFESPANLVSRVSDGAAVRASVPLGAGSVTTVIYSLPGWIATYGEGDPRAFAGAAQFEQSFGAFSTEVAGHYQRDEGPRGSLVLTMGIRELTLAGEARYELDPDHPGLPGEDANAVTAIGNFFWENSARSWTFWGEYSYDRSRRDAEIGDDDVRRDGEHLVGLAMKAPSLGGGDWRPQLTWRHALGDDSGQLILGTSGTIAPRLTLSMGVPVFYGVPGTYYRGVAETRVIEDDDTLTNEESDVLRVSGENVVSVGFGLSISFSF